MYPILTSRSHNTFEKETKLSIRFSYLQQKKKNNKNHFKLISHRKILRIRWNPRTERNALSVFFNDATDYPSLEATQSHRSPFSRQIRSRFAFVSLYYGYTLLRLIAHDHLKRVSLSPPAGEMWVRIEIADEAFIGTKKYRVTRAVHSRPGRVPTTLLSLRDYCWIPIAVRVKYLRERVK